ncbi:MAG: quinone-dependent dihydroorotate dehydrogenase [Betaproteobacteria bacterium]|nr:quinone-dependent dihydroorotate dehydrogenase [Betaproteobacteria bacterium]MDH3435520.1 quinone-dependent dihydroorotate dehydrogenase [Betaproteobacteria bacterium]
MSYALLRPLLFALEAETAHRVTLRILEVLGRTGLPRPAPPAPANCARQVMGISFPNPVGLAAGLDKNGEFIDALFRLGFGFIEIGTVTPRPQPGNPRPRVFRLPQARAVINRLGFNNDGVDRLVNNVRRTRYRGVLGINIGKNADTPIERAADDYIACLRKVYSLASYVTINISSPNTKDLRALQGTGELDQLVGALKSEQRRLADAHGKKVPLAVKIAPDLDAAQIQAIADTLRRHAIEAAIATNTTTARDEIAGQRYADETGGLSGAPLAARATAVIEQLSRALAGEVPVIGVGGILGADDARRKIEAGAQLVQLYTGLIYRGPALVAECVNALCENPIETADKRR